MPDYDFKALNDKEFEIFCIDLLSEVEKHRFERFKPGKDLGVDGRYFTNANKEIILQCKHWRNTPVTKLINTLRKYEKPKLDKLAPHRYMLAVSNPLSRSNKKSICKALSPYITSDSDIFGLEDLNDLLQKNPLIEQRHYKLWLSSSNVLKNIINNAIIGRSEFSLKEILQHSKRYAVTQNHINALKMLEECRVMLITGEPGVGKTMLADHLCLHYAASGFSFFKIVDDLKEAEAVFDHESKQIFYFDDFLGRNYLDTLKGNKSNYITQFIRRIKNNKNKRLVLTSRTTILNQGKLLNDTFEHDHLQKNEYRLQINSLNDLDKAQILYNHIWHSDLQKSYIHQLYAQHRYGKIVKHKNFNPRIINYITDTIRLKSDCLPTNYWEYIEGHLENPSQIWENPFSAQLDDFNRAMVILVVFNGGEISENILAQAYHRYLAIDENHHLKGRSDFQTNIQLLAESFLSRTVASKSSITIALLNSSIGDYIFNRYCKDEPTIRLAVMSLQTPQSLATLKNIKNNNLLSKCQTISICNAMIDHFTKNNFENVNAQYVSLLCNIYIECSSDLSTTTEKLNHAVSFVLNNKQSDLGLESFRLIKWAVQQKVVTSRQALKFVACYIEMPLSEDKIKEISAILHATSSTTTQYTKITLALKNKAIALIKNDLFYYINIADTFSQANYRKHNRTVTILKDLIEKKLSELGIRCHKKDLSHILESYDIDYELEKYFQNEADDLYQWFPYNPAAVAFNQIDELFDKD